MLAAIEPQVIREQRGIRTPPSTSFTEIMSAIAPAATEAVGQSTNNAQVASMTHAAITGAGVAASPSGAGAYGAAGISSPFSGSGYGVPDSVGYGSSGSSGGFAAGSAGGSSGLPTDPFLQQDYLLNKMRETNMQMITIQSEVQSINREWTTRSNILKAKHDTEMAQVRNFRVS